jgi:hypothetical protein
VEDSAKKMIETAAIIIKENPSIEKVIIADSVPRFDPASVDPHGLKLSWHYTVTKFIEICCSV